MRVIERDAVGDAEPLLRSRKERRANSWVFALGVGTIVVGTIAIARATTSRGADEDVFAFARPWRARGTSSLGRMWIRAATATTRDAPSLSDASLEPVRRATDASCSVRFTDPGMAMCRCAGTNAGDASGPDVVRRVAEHYFGGCSADALPVRATTCFGDEKGKCLISIGSVFSKTRSGDHVWGTGTWHAHDMYAPRAWAHRGAVVHGVRGPRTKELLDSRYFSSSSSDEHVNVEAIGDPGFLIAFTHPEITAGIKRTQRCHVRHHTDSFGAPEGVKIINAGGHKEWEDFIKEIASCTHVFSSSLHGLIFADSLGIPSRWFQRRNSKTARMEGHFKYLDYLETLPRDARWRTPSQDIADVTRDDAYPEPLSESQRRDVARRLVDHFPFELFEKVPAR